MNDPLDLTSFWTTLSKIKMVLNLSDAKLGEILELTQKQYSSLRAKQVCPPLFSVMRLSEYLEVGFVPLMKGNLDYGVLAARILNGISLLPERYTKAAFAKRRVPIYMLNYFTNIFGDIHRQSLLRHLQLSEEMFQDPNAPINILFTMDLCDHLKKYRLMSDTGLIKMGRSSSQSARSPVILNPLSKVKSVKEIYELMCNELVGKHFEKNYSYRLQKANKYRCTVVGVPNLEIEDQLGIKNAGSSAVCSLRSGFGSSFPEYINLPFARVNKLSCVHHGDTECRYEFDYEHAQSVLQYPRSTKIVPDLWLN